MNTPRVRSFASIRSFPGLLMLAVLPVQATPVFTNASFEVDNWTSVHAQVTPSGWSANTFLNWPLGWDSAHDGTSSYVASDGVQAVGLCAQTCGFAPGVSGTSSGSSWIQQAVSGFTPGQAYALTFLHSPEVGDPAYRHMVDVTLDGAAVQRFNAPGLSGVGAWTSWIQQTYLFTATTNQHTFRIAGVFDDTFDRESSVDSFQLVEVNNVPEPTTPALLALGLIGAGRAARRGHGH